MKVLALLRGINVGGKNLVPMSALAEVFTKAGCRQVRTYIQSGNVVFDSDARDVAMLSRKLADTMEQRFGFSVPVILRSSEEISAVLARNPFLAQSNAIAEDWMHVYFLADPPSAERVALLDPARSAPDAFVVQGSEIFLLLPDGMGRSKLTNAYFDSKLRTTCTARNWRTIRKLCEWMSE